jgi:hypothetical protein
VEELGDWAAPVFMEELVLGELMPVAPLEGEVVVELDSMPPGVVDEVVVELAGWLEWLEVVSDSLSRVLVLLRVPSLAQPAAARRRTLDARRTRVVGR